MHTFFNLVTAYTVVKIELSMVLSGCWLCPCGWEADYDGCSLFQLLISSKLPFRLGSKTFQLLLDNFLCHDFSILKFINGIEVRDLITVSSGNKRIRLIHFMRLNPLSITVPAYPLKSCNFKKRVQRDCLLQPANHSQPITISQPISTETDELQLTDTPFLTISQHHPSRLVMHCLTRVGG